MLLREIKGQQMERYSRSWLERLKIAMIATLPKLILIQLTAIKIQADIFADFYKMILKFIWKYKGSRRAKNNFEKEQIWGLTLSDFKNTSEL